MNSPNQHPVHQLLYELDELYHTAPLTATASASQSATARQRHRDTSFSLYVPACSGTEGTAQERERAGKETQFLSRD